MGWSRFIHLYGLVGGDVVGGASGHAEEILICHVWLNLTMNSLDNQLTFMFMKVMTIMLKRVYVMALGLPSRKLTASTQA